MIDLWDCEPLNVMPQALRKDVQVQISSFALKETMQLLLEKIAYTAVYAEIDRLPDKIIDLLARELRTQYYDVSLPIESKRQAVKKSLLWHCKAGTVSTVTELTNLVWGSTSAKVQEWFEYASDPYLFRIMVETMQSIDEDKINTFFDSLQKVKNTRSHLESITFKRRLEQNLHIGSAARSWSKTVITDVWKDTYDMQAPLCTGAETIERKRITIKEG